MMPNPSLAERLSQWLVEWRWPLLALGVVMTVVAWRPAQRLEFDRAIENMFAQDDPLLPSFRLLKRTFGGDEVVLAAYVDPNGQTSIQVALADLGCYVVSLDNDFTPGRNVWGWTFIRPHVFLGLLRSRGGHLEQEL